MTKEQEEVIAAGRKYVAHWGEAGCEAPPPYGTLYRAVRALEESEKPKPKVWTCDHARGKVHCSDGRNYTAYDSDCQQLSSNAARERIARALNLLEQTECKPCFEYRCNKCLREAGPCCTCKST